MLRERTARIMIGQNARVYGDIKDRSLHHNNGQELFTNYFNNNLSVFPSRAPVLSFAHYFQAPATQAISTMLAPTRGTSVVGS